MRVASSECYDIAAIELWFDLLRLLKGYGYKTAQLRKAMWRVPGYHGNDLQLAVTQDLRDASCSPLFVVAANDLKVFEFPFTVYWCNVSVDLYGVPFELWTIDLTKFEADDE